MCFSRRLQILWFYWSESYFWQKIQNVPLHTRNLWERSFYKGFWCINVWYRMCRFDFFSTRWPTSFRNVSKLLILPYDLVWTTTSCCGTRISKHFRNLRSQNLHQNLARVDQFSKGFGVYIFGVKYFILVFLRFPARFIGNVSELFISQYDLVGTSTFWCNTEMSRHSHFFRLPKFPSKTFQNRSVL